MIAAASGTFLRARQEFAKAVKHQVNVDKPPVKPFTPLIPSSSIPYTKNLNSIYMENKNETVFVDHQVADDVAIKNLYKYINHSMNLLILKHRDLKLKVYWNKGTDNELTLFHGGMKFIPQEYLEKASRTIQKLGAQQSVAKIDNYSVLQEKLEDLLNLRKEMYPSSIRSNSIKDLIQTKAERGTINPLALLKNLAWIYRNPALDPISWKVIVAGSSIHNRNKEFAKATSNKVGGIVYNINDNKIADSKPGFTYNFDMSKLSNSINSEVSDISNYKPHDLFVNEQSNLIDKTIDSISKETLIDSDVQKFIGAIESPLEFVPQLENTEASKPVELMALSEGRKSKHLNIVIENCPVLISPAFAIKLLRRDTSSLLNMISRIEECTKPINKNDTRSRSQEDIVTVLSSIKLNNYIHKLFTILQWSSISRELILTLLLGYSRLFDNLTTHSEYYKISKNTDKLLDFFGPQINLLKLHTYAITGTAALIDNVQSLRELRFQIRYVTHEYNNFDQNVFKYTKELLENQTLIVPSVRMLGQKPGQNFAYPPVQSLDRSLRHGMSGYMSNWFKEPESQRNLFLLLKEGKLRAIVETLPHMKYTNHLDKNNIDSNVLKISNPKLYIKKDSGYQNYFTRENNIKLHGGKSYHTMSLSRIFLVSRASIVLEKLLNSPLPLTVYRLADLVDNHPNDIVKDLDLHPINDLNTVIKSGTQLIDPTLISLLIGSYTSNWWKETSKIHNPVITVAGHVDHGKTSTLDTLLGAHVVQNEVGGITQCVRLGVTELSKDKKVTVIDTPGHAVFKTMRERSVEAADVIFLVIAYRDGIKQQTEEILSLAHFYKKPVHIYINKIDNFYNFNDLFTPNLSQKALTWYIAIQALPHINHTTLHNILESFISTNKVDQINYKTHIPKFIEGKVFEQLQDWLETDTIDSDNISDVLTLKAWLNQDESVSNTAVTLNKLFDLPIIMLYKLWLALPSTCIKEFTELIQTLAEKLLEDETQNTDSWLHLQSELFESLKNISNKIAGISFGSATKKFGINHGFSVARLYTNEPTNGTWFYPIELLRGEQKQYLIHGVVKGGNLSKNSVLFNSYSVNNVSTIWYEAKSVNMALPGTPIMIELKNKSGNFKNILEKMKITSQSIGVKKVTESQYNPRILNPKHLKIILRASTLGSIEAIKASLPKNIDIISIGTGEPLQKDYDLALRIPALIFTLGFPPLNYTINDDAEVALCIKSLGPSVLPNLVREHSLLHELLAELNEAVKHSKEPEYSERVNSVAIVRVTSQYTLRSNGGKRKVRSVAELEVISGSLRDNAEMKIYRSNTVLQLTSTMSKTQTPIELFSVLKSQNDLNLIQKSVRFESFKTLSKSSVAIGESVDCIFRAFDDLKVGDIILGIHRQPRKKLFNVFFESILSNDALG